MNEINIIDLKNNSLQFNLDIFENKNSKDINFSKDEILNFFLNNNFSKFIKNLV